MNSSGEIKLALNILGAILVVAAFAGPERIGATAASLKRFRHSLVVGFDRVFNTFAKPFEPFLGDLVKQLDDAIEKRRIDEEEAGWISIISMILIVVFPLLAFFRSLWQREWLVAVVLLFVFLFFLIVFIGFLACVVVFIVLLPIVILLDLAHLGIKSLTKRIVMGLLGLLCYLINYLF